MKKVKISIIVLISIILSLLVAAYFFLKANTYQPMEQALEVLEHYAEETPYGYRIMHPNAEANLVFYPGGLVEPESYAVLLKSISDNQVNVYLVDMPLNLAIIQPNQFDSVREIESNQLPWFIMGHSLGGTSALLHVANNLDQVTGVVLLASYPSGSVDLASEDLPILSISASLDGVINWDAYDDSKRQLPEDTVYKEIAGGNHGQFGHYGFQSGDQEATLSRTEQQRQVTDFIRIFIEDSVNHN